MDDSRAKSVAKNLGIPIIETVGILVKAKQASLIKLLKPMLLDLETNGFYLGNALRDEALRLVGE